MVGWPDLPMLILRCDRHAYARRADAAARRRVGGSASGGADGRSPQVPAGDRVNQLLWSRGSIVAINGDAVCSSNRPARSIIASIEMTILVSSGPSSR